MSCQQCPPCAQNTNEHFNSKKNTENTNEKMNVKQKDEEDDLYDISTKDWKHTMKRVIPLLFGILIACFLLHMYRRQTSKRSLVRKLLDSVLSVAMNIFSVFLLATAFLFGLPSSVREDVREIRRNGGIV